MLSLIRNASRACRKTGIIYVIIAITICWLLYTERNFEARPFNRHAGNTNPQEAQQDSQRKPISPVQNGRMTGSSIVSSIYRAKPKASIWKQSKRVGVIAYMPNRLEYLKQFIALLYGSWKHIVDNVDQIADWKATTIRLAPDLLIFCHPKLCSRLSKYCTSHPSNSRENNSASDLDSSPIVKNESPTCWWVLQDTELITPYTSLNAFAMFNRSDIEAIARPYDYLLRTDIDCFLSPRIFDWQMNHSLTVGKGGYCDDFNMARLKMIAKKLNITHRGVHCVGSTWFGENKLFVAVARMTINLTIYMYDNEFDPKAPGLESINFTVNREGEWSRWWRPVSLLYGAELATNDMIPAFSQAHKQNYDASSCSKKPVWKFPHIHCWHDPCNFSKFRFKEIMDSLRRKDGNVSVSVAVNILKYSSFKWTENITIQEYSTFIAWNSLAKHWTDMLTNEGV